jgi:hypothetical protein
MTKEQMDALKVGDVVVLERYVNEDGEDMTNGKGYCERLLHGQADDSYVRIPIPSTFTVTEAYDQERETNFRMSPAGWHSEMVLAELEGMPEGTTVKIQKGAFFSIASHLIMRNFEVVPMAGKRPAAREEPRFNCKCAACGSDALHLFVTIECSNGKCRFFKKEA